MIVDACTLAGAYYLRDDPMGFPELFALMERTGVATAATMGTRALYADAWKGNASLFATASKDPRVMPIGVVWPHASASEAAGLVEECVRNGAVALALWLGDAAGALASLTFRRALAEAGRPGLPLVFPAVMSAGVLTRVAEMTRGLGCPVLFLGPYYGLLAELLAVLEEHPHVRVDTGWQVTPDAIELLVDSAGPDRVLFGSGAPFRPIQPALNTVLDADIETAVKRKILAANALRLFGRADEAERAGADVSDLPPVRKPAAPVIDIHCHLGVIPAAPMKLRDVDCIEHHVRREGFEYAVCSAPVAYREDLEGGNLEMMEKLEGRPRLLGSPVISPTHLQTSIRWLDMAASDRRIGHVTLDPDNEAERHGSDLYMRLFEEAAKRRVTVFYNSGAQDLSSAFRWQRFMGHFPRIRGASKDEYQMLLDIGKRFPDLPIILGHGMGLDGLRLAEQTRSTYIELSGSYPERAAVRKAIDRLGPERVVFGTDLDMITPAFALGIYYEADMSPAEEQLVMAGNARRLLRLPAQ